MPYQRRNNRRNNRNQRRPRKPSEDPILKQARGLFYKPFTFQGYLKSMSSNPKLYSALFMMKLRAGFAPTPSEIEYILNSNRPELNDISEFLQKNRYLEQSRNVVSGYF